MNTQAIHTTAKSLTVEQIAEQVAAWKATRNAAKLYAFNSLLDLGDSEALAMATVLGQPEVEQEEPSEMYRLAYYS
jgi:hypothetical protein